jgi:hypothetical protein
VRPHEDQSSPGRLASSRFAHGLERYPEGAKATPRMNKHEREHRPRGLRKSGKPGGEERMRFAGIDIGGERHAVAVVNEGGAILVKATFFGGRGGIPTGSGPSGRSARLCGGDGGDGTLLA